MKSSKLDLNLGSNLMIRYLWSVIYVKLWVILIGFISYDLDIKDGLVRIRTASDFWIPGSFLDIDMNPESDSDKL